MSYLRKKKNNNNKASIKQNISNKIKHDNKYYNEKDNSKNIKYVPNKINQIIN